MQADPKKLAAAATVTAITANHAHKKDMTSQGHASKAAAGTSSKPLAANQVLTPKVKPTHHTAKQKPLPSRYIPPGFERGKIPPPKKSQPAKKASSNASFMVQVGSFKSNEATAKLRKQLRKQGYTVHVKKADVKGKAVFRVMVGPYHGGKKAKHAKAALKKAMGISGLILKNK